MKRILISYARYNGWANQKLIECMLSLSKDDLQKAAISSYPGLLPTVLHLWNAEAIWWQRIKLAEHVELPGDSFRGEFPEASALWLDQIGRAHV